jgi:hypothetical protein
MIKLLRSSLLVLSFGSLLTLHAQQNKSPQQGCGMGMHGMMDSTAMCAMMMMNMMKPGAAFALPDGGFVVIMGNKISKYDKDLILKKEIEMKIDTTAFKKMIHECPMMKQGKPGTGTDTTGKH